MDTLIIYCHPHKKSHNHRILEAVEAQLKKDEREFRTVDLYKEEFDAYLKPVEYERASITKERKTEDDVVKYQEMIRDADNLIFIYPVWWYNMPARLKGFIDRVFTPGFAYNFKRTTSFERLGAALLSYIPGVSYLMQRIAVTHRLKGKRAYIFRTYGGPKTGKRLFGNASAKVLEQALLRFVGFSTIVTKELFHIDTPVHTEERMKAYLDTVRVTIKSMPKAPRLPE